MTQNFKNLTVYQESYALLKEVYKKLQNTQTHFRLKEQLFGSASSICANLAEMSAFENKNQQKQKIITCIGESNETEFWLDFINDADLISTGEYDALMAKLKRVRIMLFNLLKSIKLEASGNGGHVDPKT